MKLTLKSTLISKFSSCTFEVNLYFKDKLNYSGNCVLWKISHPLQIFHNVSLMSSEVSMSEHVTIIILNDLLIVVCLKVNQIYFFWQYLFRRWCNSQTNSRVFTSIYKKVGKFHCYLLLSLQEKVRNIFKKYGLTISAVVLVVGKGLKSVAKGVWDGFKTLGGKFAAILPSLMSLIIGFISRAAESVISFLSQNAWLLILGVAIFMVEWFQNKKWWIKKAKTRPAEIKLTFTIISLSCLSFVFYLYLMILSSHELQLKSD